MENTLAKTERICSCEIKKTLSVKMKNQLGKMKNQLSKKGKSAH
jgi:hypothetical protein